MKSTFTSRVLSALTVVLLALAGCGGEETEKPVEEAGTTAQGDPDGGVADRVSTPREILAALHHRLTTGEGLQTQQWHTDVQRLAEALWPADEEGRVPLAGRTHTSLAGLAGSAAPHVLDETSTYFDSNPEDRTVYDAFLAAVVQGPERYKEWCEGEGLQVFEAFKEARRQRILGG